MKKLLSVLAVAAVVLGVGISAVPAEDVDGQALYDKKCAMCHGKDGVAKKMAEGSSNLNDPEWKKTPMDDTLKAITEGAGKMKGYKDKLSEAEIKAIAEYVYKL